MVYPATLEVDVPDKTANWRPLVQWLLAIPHLVVVYFLQIAASVVALISWFVILFTGKLPEGIAGFQAMVLRYQLRVTAYSGFLFSDYPPFDFDTSSPEPGGTPVTLNVVPALEDRNRLTVGLRLLWVIPVAIFAAVIYLAASVVWIVAFFAVLFTGRWPEGMQQFIVKALRLTLQVNAYALLLTDEYPPFALTPDSDALDEV